jgi:hypothetical protein
MRGAGVDPEQLLDVITQALHEGTDRTTGPPGSDGRGVPAAPDLGQLENQVRSAVSGWLPSRIPLNRPP